MSKSLIVLGLIPTLQAGNLGVLWSDCGDNFNAGELTSLEPTEVTIGSATKLTTSGLLAMDVAGATLTTVVKTNGVQVASCTGDASEDIVCNIPNEGSVTVNALHMPLKAGSVEFPLEVTVGGPYVPHDFDNTTYHISATSSIGVPFLCLDVLTHVTSRTTSNATWQIVSDAFTNATLLGLELGKRKKRHRPQITRHKVEMDDGVLLTTYLFNPYPYDAKKGTVVCRSPYGPTTENLADVFVSSKNALAAVIQDDRGTFTSGGTWNLWKGAANDYNTTVNWIATQPHSDGKIYTVGISADGINEVELVRANPRVVRGQWFTWTTMNGHSFAFDNGAYRKDIADSYLTFMDKIFVHGEGKRIKQEVRHHEGWDHWYANLTACPDGDDTRPDRDGCSYRNVRWPVVYSGGWWDIFSHTGALGWKAVTTASAPEVRDKHVAIFGPLGHCVIDVRPESWHLVQIKGEAQAMVKAARLSAEFFQGETNGKMRQSMGRVNWFVTGGYGLHRSIFERKPNWNHWVSGNDFPTPSYRNYYLQAGGSLSLSPSSSDTSTTYVYDPHDPAPMYGGNNVPLPGMTGISVCGTAEQKNRDFRNDVISFDSEPLAMDTAVLGELHATLWVSSTAKDTDFVVTVSDVCPDSSEAEEITLESGAKSKKCHMKSALVRYGVRRMRWRENTTAIQVHQSPSMVAGQVYQADMTLQWTSYVFPKGHRIRVTVASAAYPYYSAQSNSGVNDLFDNVTLVTAENTVYFALDKPSHVSLPIVSATSLTENKKFAEPDPDFKPFPARKCGVTPHCFQHMQKICKPGLGPICDLCVTAHIADMMLIGGCGPLQSLGTQSCYCYGDSGDDNSTVLSV